MAGRIRRVCVFCGAGAGTVPSHLDLARGMGQALAARGLGLVYGGGPDGLMGRLARACIDAGGEATAVVPRFLVEREPATDGVLARIVTADLYERKQVMAARSDAFVVLPGGLGTLDEFFEVASWATLGLHGKPLIILNADDFWAPLMGLLDHVARHGFVARSPRPLWLEARSVSEAMALLGA